MKRSEINERLRDAVSFIKELASSFPVRILGAG